MSAGAASPPPPTPSPLVSVISIFLNGEAFFVEAIESVLAQTCQDFELLLVDDGSTDGSTRIAREYAARHPGRVRYLEHPGHANRGMSATRNLGIAAARGRTIAFIDADDVWRPEKLEEQLAIMAAHPGIGMVCGAVNYWRSWAPGDQDVIVPTGHVTDRAVPPPEAMLALYPLGAAAAPCPSDLLLRADVVRAVGGFEAHFTGARMMYEDQGFLAKLYLAAPVYFSGRTWTLYRQHAASCVASVTGDGRYHEVRRYFLEWLETYVAARPDVDRRVAAALRRALRRYRRPRLDAALRRARNAPGTAGRIARRWVRGVAARARPADS